MNAINPKFNDLYIKTGDNPYSECIQGLANEPICVHALLVKTEKLLQISLGDISLEIIVQRLVQNRPRVAIIGGSMDHPAHLLDEEYACRAAARIWYNGGVPFYFGIPIICDGTAQNNIGQSYSLASRNHTASAVNINFEGHSYHAAWVISGCDKSPSGILAGLAAADLARMARNQPPVWVNFIPCHVLKGGTIPKDTEAKLMEIEQCATASGHKDLAVDIAENRRYILQCSSDEAFWGQLRRAEKLGLISSDACRLLMNQLAVATCDKAGGVCAFNGTGNSSRTLVCSLGLVPKELELLCSSPSQEQINQAMDQFFDLFNKPEYGLRNLLKANFANSVKIHSATGSSSNILLHLPAIMRYAGFDITIDDYKKIRQSASVPEIFDHNLTEDRDTFVLAQQFMKGQNHGMESLYKTLDDLGIPMDLDALTIEGKSWGARICSIDTAIDQSLGQHSVIKDKPIRDRSGVDILSGNFCSSAVVKVSGMSNQQYQHFDGRFFIIKYYENEHLCNADLMAPDFMEKLTSLSSITSELLEAFAYHNGFDYQGQTAAELLQQKLLSFCFVIAGQGPKAYGMPEMFSPSHNLRHHHLLEATSILLTDGRYSGVTKGACIGHTTPEAFEGGAIGALNDGDILWLNLSDNQMNIVDTNAFIRKNVKVLDTVLTQDRKQLLQQRNQQATMRQLEVAASNLLDHTTSAEKGVVPLAVDQRISYFSK